jgi:hypothetical protein
LRKGWRSDGHRGAEGRKRKLSAVDKPKNCEYSKAGNLKEGFLLFVSTIQKEISEDKAWKKSFESIVMAWNLP